MVGGDTVEREVTAAWYRYEVNILCVVQIGGGNAMVRVATAMGQWTGPDLTSHLTSAGLQAERANLLTSQVCCSVMSHAVQYSTVSE